MGRVKALPMGLDVTELPDTDQLYDGGPAVRRARQLAAQAAGATDTLLLVGGATVGVQVLAALGEGPLIVSRNAHRSVFWAAWLQRRPLVAVAPRWDGEELLLCESIPALAEAAARHPGGDVWVTRPDYYGRVADIAALPEGRLLVDAAHGAHFSFSPRLPDSPAGRAFAWVESAHKTLAAPTQTAWLHLSAAADAARAEELLMARQTSSPSWLLLAGLDRARALARRADWDRLLTRCDELVRSVSAATGLIFNRRAWAQARGYADQDPTRLVVDVRPAGYTGFEAAAFLRARGVQPEMADFCRVVFICTPWNTGRDFARLRAALRALWRSRRPRPPVLKLSAPAAGPTVCPAWEALSRPRVAVPLVQAAGRVAATMAGAYPPGWPAFLPGEVITPEAVEWLAQAAALGGTLFGLAQERIEVLQ